MLKMFSSTTGGQSQRQLTMASVVSVNETTDKTHPCDWHQCGADGTTTVRCSAHVNANFFFLF